jgi:hypothetical protein
MTKISQKEYIDTILSMVHQTCKSVVYKHMADELGLIKTTFDTKRVIDIVISDSLHILNKNIEKFISENGIPRKQRTKKGMNEKKRKPNAYILYCHQHRDQVKKEMPAGTRAGEVTKRLSEMWNNLSEEEQAEYECNQECEEDDSDCE